MSETRYTHEEWSSEQSEASVTVDGHDLSVAFFDSADEGEADTANDDPPVVFLHGIPTWSYLWRDVAPAVAEATDRRVVVPDMLGYGNSAMHDGFDRSVRVQEVMLRDLLDELEIDEFALVAHDIGGGVAVRYAAHRPGEVTDLVMANAVCYDSWPVEFISNLGLPDTAEQDPEEFQAMLDGAFRQGLYDDDVDETFVEGIAAPWTTEPGQVSLSRNAVATNTNHTTEIDYGEIAADLLCLWGGQDVMQPLAYGERLAEEVGGDVIELDAYHWVVEDRPERFAEEVSQFIAK
ncbi:Pimeloyl-ACP methyl ester carboxylesterase [Halorientalis persicus]|uniref:Pimeloyl-ACP methyl ester carboxylesterase n=1 Tax=Halorientalis persicus TaxID=1367881 RepID=A0A1H8KW47_9EURY|nr:alpha/beta hydrolase [Halorientalis persicus]SEN97160.1 Pimeloyl-ACP methyl ester carboxylesterase [Halorientalis persicus]